MSALAFFRRLWESIFGPPVNLREAGVKLDQGEVTKPSPKAKARRRKSPPKAHK